MTEQTYLGSREVAKLLRSRLREAFPGVKMSVRCDRGTAYGWIDVSWTDGPREDDVRAVCDPWQGSDFDGMQDMLVHREPLLVALKPGQLPVPVRPVVDGINYHRTMSPGRLLAAQDVIRRHLAGFTAYGPDGRQGPDAGTWFDVPGPLYAMLDRPRGDLTGYGLTQAIAQTLPASQ